MKRRLIHVDVKPVETAAMLAGETHEEVSGQAAKLTLTQMAFFFFLRGNKQRLEPHRVIYKKVQMQDF